MAAAGTGAAGAGGCAAGTAGPHWIGLLTLQTSWGRLKGRFLKMLEVGSGFGLVYCEWQDEVVDGKPGAMSYTKEVWC